MTAPNPTDLLAAQVRRDSTCNHYERLVSRRVQGDKTITDAQLDRAKIAANLADAAYLAVGRLAGVTG